MITMLISLTENFYSVTVSKYHITFHKYRKLLLVNYGNKAGCSLYENTIERGKKGM